MDLEAKSLWENTAGEARNFSVFEGEQETDIAVIEEFCSLQGI